MILTIFSDPTAYKTGSAFPSGSILYTGPVLQFLSNSTNPITFPCNGNLNQVLNLFDQAVNNLLVQNNLTALEPGDLVFDPATVQVNQLHQVEINAINALQSQYTSLSEMFNNLNVGNLDITINMQCLSSIAAPCESGTNVYPLISVLNSMLSEICALKAVVGI
jgi:hypothetical protein